MKNVSMPTLAIIMTLAVLTTPLGVLGSGHQMMNSIDVSGWDFVVGAASDIRGPEWWHTHVNNDSEPIRVSYGVARSVRSSVTAASPAVMTAIVLHAGRLEGTVGTSTTRDTTYTFTVPPHKQVHLIAGSVWRHVWGTERYWDCGVILYQTSSHGEFTTGGFSRTETAERDQ